MGESDTDLPSRPFVEAITPRVIVAFPINKMIEICAAEESLK